MANGEQGRSSSSLQRIQCWLGAWSIYLVNMILCFLGRRDMLMPLTGQVTLFPMSSKVLRAMRPWSNRLTVDASRTELLELCDSHTRFVVYLIVSTMPLPDFRSICVRTDLRPSRSANMPVFSGITDLLPRLGSILLTLHALLGAKRKHLIIIVVLYSVSARQSRLEAQ